MKSKNKHIMIANLVAIVTVALVVASYIWTVSFKFARFEEKLDRLIRDFESSMPKIDQVPILDFRTTQTENQLGKIEPRLEALEKKINP